MNAPLQLRVMTPGDLSFADRLRALAGWNQTVEDWQRFMAAEPHGCFVAEWAGEPAGTATTITYGLEVGWIGMVLVHPGFRRRGIGGALLKQCLTYLRSLGIGCTKLDATPLGKTVYDQLGFQDEWTFSRWVVPAACEVPAGPVAGIRNWREGDWDSLELLDRAAFGVPRRKVWSVLARQSQSALVFESPAGGIAGAGLLRAGSQAGYLGPVIATRPEIGGHLVRALIALNPGRELYWDLPDQNQLLAAWARAARCTVQRSLTRMHLGPNRQAGAALQQIALAGPEIG